MANEDISENKIIKPILELVTFSYDVKNMEINKVIRAISVNNKVSFFHLG